MSSSNPRRHRRLEQTRTGTLSRESSSTRLDNWRGSLRAHRSSPSASPTKSSPTTAATSVVIAQPELSLPAKLIRRRSSNSFRPPPDSPYDAAIPALEPTSTPPNEPTSPTTQTDQITPPSHTHTPLARRRRTSSISPSSSRSSPRSLSPPTYSAPLPDPPPTFMDTTESDVDLSNTNVSPPPPAFTPPTPQLDRDLPPSPAQTTSITSGPQPHQEDTKIQETTSTATGTWWDYVSWTSSTLTTRVYYPDPMCGSPESGQKDEVTSQDVTLAQIQADAGFGSPPNPACTSASSISTLPTSPPPPLIPFPITDAQQATDADTKTTPESIDRSNQLDITTATNKLDKSSIPETINVPDSNKTDKAPKADEGGWYSYVPWSRGFSGSVSTSSGLAKFSVAEAEAESPVKTEGEAQGSAAAQQDRGIIDPITEIDSQIQAHEGDSTSPSTSINSDPTSNPITTSFQTDTLTWASFLGNTRRMLGVKRLTTEHGGVSDKTVMRDENGIEVMEVDFDDGEAEGDKKADDKRVGNVELPPLVVSGESKSLKENQEVDGNGTSTGTIAVSSGSGTKGTTPTSGSPAASGTPSGATGLASRFWPSTTSTTTPTTTSANPTPIPSRPPTPFQTTPQRHASPAPSKRSASSKSKLPNTVLPKWEETFFSPPRSVVSSTYHTRVRHRARRTNEEAEGVGRESAMLSRGASGDEGIGGKFLGRTVRFVSGLLGGAAGVVGAERRDSIGGSDVVAKVETSTEIERRLGGFGEELPKAWKVLEGVGDITEDVLRGCKKVVVIGVHGWFPGAIVRTVLGEPTGTSMKFASMMGLALEEFERENRVVFEKVTLVPLEGEGTIDKRVERLYTNLLSNSEWTRDLHECDALFFATHSQGCVVSTHLLDRLLADQHVVTHTQPGRKSQRVCILGLCGIHLGPLRYLSSSTLVGPYLQYFESIAARELFEFQNTESQVSKNYVRALENVLDHGTKIVYIASLNDQLVPMYSGLFTAASHPLILRALYIDGDAYSSSDFLSNLLTLLIRIRNSGLSDSGLLAHLSEATAGSLNGVGHSRAYEEIGNYTLAVKYLFLTNDGLTDHETNQTKLSVEPFNALLEQNDYEIPWSLRDVIAHPFTTLLFSSEIEALREGFKAWHPKTAVLRELRKKVAPLGRSSSVGGSGSEVASKL